MENNESIFGEPEEPKSRFNKIIDSICSYVPMVIFVVAFWYFSKSDTSRFTDYGNMTYFAVFALVSAFFVLLLVFTVADFFIKKIAKDKLKRTLTSVGTKITLFTMAIALVLYIFAIGTYMIINPFSFAQEVVGRVLIFIGVLVSVFFVLCIKKKKNKALLISVGTTIAVAFGLMLLFVAANKNIAQNKSIVDYMYVNTNIKEPFEIVEQDSTFLATKGEFYKNYNNEVYNIRYFRSDVDFAREAFLRSWKKLYDDKAFVKIGNTVYLIPQTTVSSEELLPVLQEFDAFSRQQENKQNVQNN